MVGPHEEGLHEAWVGLQERHGFGRDLARAGQKAVLVESGEVAVQCLGEKGPRHDRPEVGRQAQPVARAPVAEGLAVYLQALPGPQRDHGNGIERSDHAGL